MDITRITLTFADGSTETYEGIGQAHLNSTRTEVEGLPPAQWPTLSWIGAHLVIKRVIKRRI